MSTKKGIKTVVSLTATALALLSLTACSSNKNSNSGNGSNKTAATTSSSAKTVAKLPTDTGDDLTDLMNTAKNQNLPNVVVNNNSTASAFQISLTDGWGLSFMFDAANNNTWITSIQGSPNSDDTQALLQAETYVVNHDNLGSDLVSNPGSLQPTTSQLKQILRLLSVDKNGTLIYTGGTN